MIKKSTPQDLSWRRFARQMLMPVFLLAGAYQPVFAQTPVIDVARLKALVEQSGLMQNISDRMGDVRKLEEEKLKSQMKISDQMGALATANLQSNSFKTETNPAVQSAAIETKSLVDGVDSSGASYAKWDEQRRASELVMDSQLSTLLSSGGKPLDWTGHAQLSAQLKTLTNDRIASSIVATNATTERRIKNKEDEAKALRLELEADQRVAAEARLAESLRSSP